jgi:hypothetical protein
MRLRHAGTSFSQTKSLLLSLLVLWIGPIVRLCLEKGSRFLLEELVRLGETGASVNRPLFWVLSYGLGQMQSLTICPALSIMLPLWRESRLKHAGVTVCRSRLVPRSIP